MKAPRLHRPHLSGQFRRGGRADKTCKQTAYPAKVSPHSKTAYAVENQRFFELTGMRKKAPLFPATFTPLNPPILEMTCETVQVVHDHRPCTWASMAAALSFALILPP